MCPKCRNGVSIPETEPVNEDEHGKFRVCPKCDGSANLPDEPFRTRTDVIKEQIRESWAGQEPEDIAMAFLEDLEALIANDPHYFANGRGNSLSHTLQMAANNVALASKATYEVARVTRFTTETSSTALSMAQNCSISM